MDVLTDIIKKEIKKQYKSVRNFSNEIGIAQTTLASALKNGISGTAYETVIKICNKLDIKLVNYQFPVQVDNNALKMLDIYSKLDEKGKHAVHTVLMMEYEKYKYDISDYEMAAFSGRVKQNKNIIRQSRIADLLED